MNEEFLASSEVIDWKHPLVLERAKSLAHGQPDQAAVAKACFEWVRDEIRHSADFHLNPVTCRASDVLRFRTGYCYAKSHLLAALLRANGIPAALCYQRLSIDDVGAPYSLHGLNAVYLPDYGWYRIDARGNKPGVSARFVPPVEKLAFAIKLPEESDVPGRFADPLPAVRQALESFKTWDALRAHLPDLPPV